MTGYTVIREKAPDKPMCPHCLTSETGEDRWVLYECDGGFNIVAWFTTEKDAEFARAAFEAHESVKATP